MTRIGIVVEPEFLQRHWGVRVYVYSLSKWLARHNWTVDFLSPHRSSAGELRWHKLHLRDESIFEATAPSAAGDPREVLRELRNAAFQRSGPSSNHVSPRVSVGLKRPETMPIGASLAVEDYDTILITNPWMVSWQGRLPARQVLGVVYDLIPNIFGLTLDENKPFAFAHQHAHGFRYFEEACDQILAISEATRSAYLELVRARRPGGKGPKVVALPPFAPYHSLDEPTEPCPASRPARMVLAGCFDLRKGLRELPEILNGLSDVIEEVVIYGGARCRQSDVETFFNQLRIERVAWHLGPTAHEVRDIFRHGRMLLFPSKFEGLGLPILEAQLEGCRVATHAVSPMQDLALGGAVMLADSTEESVERLQKALREPFDHAALRAEARAAFVDPMQMNPLDTSVSPSLCTSLDSREVGDNIAMAV